MSSIGRTRGPVALTERIACLAIAVSVGGCGGASVPDPFSEAPTSGESEYSQGTPDEIIPAEVLRHRNNSHTAMALIRRLRPAWLRARGQNSFTDLGAAYPVVYIDEIRHGGLPTLYQIPSTEILRMEFFSTADATTRWGTGHQSGAINIVTGR